MQTELAATGVSTYLHQSWRFTRQFVTQADCNGLTRRYRLFAVPPQKARPGRCRPISNLSTFSEIQERLTPGRLQSPIQSTRCSGLQSDRFCSSCVKRMSTALLMPGALLYAPVLIAKRRPTFLDQERVPNGYERCS